MRISKRTSQLNKGFSLVELIVSIAILAIVGAAIIAFFSMSMRQYKTNTDETSLQLESRLTWKRLESNILIANAGIWTSDNTSIDLYSIDSIDSNKVEKHKTRIFFVPATSEEPAKLCYLEYTLSDKNWELSEGQDESDPQLFSSLVSAFNIKIYNAKGEEIIGIDSQSDKPVKVVAHIEYEANGRTYSSDNTVAIRSDIVASNDIDAIYGE